jgi:transcriptional accessory protein Tex/SPT6
MKLSEIIKTTVREYLNEQKMLNKEIKTLYHGNKSGGKLSEINFDNHTYFYLTPIYRYALDYAKGNEDNVTEFKIDTSKLLDLRSFNINKIDAKTFYQKTKQYFPSKVLSKFPNYSLWELIRLDFDGEMKKTFQSRGFDGFIIIEKKNNELFESYVLFNLNPIVGV